MMEEAYFSSAAQKDCFNELDVEQYEIVATLDSHTSDICRSLDGKVFPMKDYEPGVTAPPFHVYCRSTTVPYFEDDFGQPGERAARGEDGKTYYVPSDMTYEEWKETFVGGGDESGLAKNSLDEENQRVYRQRKLKWEKQAVSYKKDIEKQEKFDTIKEKDTVIHKSVGAKAKNYKVQDKFTGIEYEFAPGTRIQNSEVFAGKGTKHPLHEGVAEGLTIECGGTPEKWQHAKGNGILLDPVTGEEYPAEVHWFQEETVGKVKFKVKRWLDEG